MMKRDLDRRLDRLEARANVRQIGIIPIVNVLGWPDEARHAYNTARRAGDDAACHALLEHHYGPLPQPVAGDIAVIIVRDHPANLDTGPDDDEGPDYQTIRQALPVDPIPPVDSDPAQPITRAMPPNSGYTSWNRNEPRQDPYAGMPRELRRRFIEQDRSRGLR